MSRQKPTAAETAIKAAVTDWLDQHADEILDRAVQRLADHLTFEQTFAEFEQAGLIRTEGSRVFLTEKAIAYAKELETECPPE